MSEGYAKDLIALFTKMYGQPKRTAPEDTVYLVFMDPAFPDNILVSASVSTYYRGLVESTGQLVSVKVTDIKKILN